MRKWQFPPLVAVLVLQALVLPHLCFGQLDGCVELSSTELVCIADTDGDLQLTFEVLNTSPFPIDRIFLWPNAASNPVTSETEYVLGPIAPGASSGPLVATFEAFDNPQLCFDVSFHDSSTGDCCGSEVCLDIPNCNGAITFRRGDCMNDNVVGLTDVIALLSHLFLGEAPPAGPFPDCGWSQLETDRELGCEVVPQGCTR